MVTKAWVALTVAVVMALDVGCRGRRASSGPPNSADAVPPSVSRAQHTGVPTANGTPYTELSRAVMHNELAKVRHLLAQGADPNAKDTVGTAPLHWAARGDSTELVGLLLEKGADVNGRDPGGGTPLHNAASSGSLAVARLLIHRGADANARDVNDGTPLHEAAVRGSAQMEQLLLSAGAEVNARDAFGHTPLYWAASDDLEPEAVEVLRDHGGME